MTTSTLNETFFVIKEKNEVNKNLCFNTELLDRCRTISPRIEKYLKNYGTLVEPELQLIEVDSIHGLEPIINKRTGQTRPRGFQVRSEEDIDSTVVEDLAYSMNAKEWDPCLNQAAFFRLGEDWEYTDNFGRKKMYGIANGTHRYTAAVKSGQTHIIGWVIDIHIKYLKKWATAEANRQVNSCKPRSDRDIIESIVFDLNSEESDLFKKIDGCSNSEYQPILMDEIKDYNVSSSKANKILRGVIHESDLKPERKQWGSQQMISFCQEQRLDWVKIAHPIYDFETKDQSAKIILIQDEGSGVHKAVDKYIAHLLGPNKDDKLLIVFSLAKLAKVTKENRKQLREAFRTKVNDKLNSYYLAMQLIYVKMTHVVPLYVYLPEFDDESLFMVL